MKLPDDRSRVGLSVVLEWENVKVAGRSRCARLLAELRDQLRRLRAEADGIGAEASRSFLRTLLDSPVELLVVHDERLGSEEIARFLHSVIPATESGLDLRLLPAPFSGQGQYYELKNFGATNCRGDLILLLDSDVIPEPGWLFHLITPLADPRVGAVGGRAYVDPNSLLAKAAALFWYFPLRSAQGSLEASEDRSFANNVVFRREVFLESPFPRQEGRSRGAERALSRQLASRGIVVLRSTHAQVSHPAFNSPGAFVARGISLGRDQWLRHCEDGPWVGPERVSAIGRYVGHLRDSFKSIVRNRKRVGLRALQVPIALALACFFHTFSLAGELMVRVAPALVRGRFLRF